MEKGRNNTILLTVIGIATLLVAVAGATFAYFTARIQDTDSAYSVLTIKTGKGPSLDFVTSKISLENIYPRDAAWSTKVLSLTMNTKDLGSDFYYIFTFDYSTNFTSDAISYTIRPVLPDDPTGVCLKYKGDTAGETEPTATVSGSTMESSVLKYSYKCSDSSAPIKSSSDANDIVAADMITATSKHVGLAGVTNTDEDSDGSVTPTTKSDVLVGTDVKYGTFHKPSSNASDVNVTHVYEVKFFFDKTASSQNADQEKSFYATVGLEQVNDTSKYSKS